MGTGRRIILAAAVLTIVGAAYFAYRQVRTDDAGPDSASNSAKPAASPTATALSKPKTPLDLPRTVSLPGGWEQPNIFVKPGHWSSLWIEGESTQRDYLGRLSAELRAESNSRADPPWGKLENRRSVTLPKLQLRVAELSFYVPNAPDPSFAVASLAATGRKPGERFGSIESPLGASRVVLSLAHGSTTDLQVELPVTVLRDHQSLAVVLAGRPDAYRFYGKLDFSAAPHESQISSPEQRAHYRVVIADDPQRAPLPSSVLQWTSTGVVFWDRYDPARLTEAQRRALVDWLHWGGQLVISGPESLDLLAGGFLAPSLPAQAGGTVELDDDALRPLDGWTISGANAFRGEAWRGVKLVPQPEARTLVGDGDAPLVVERRVGRGRVVVTAFRLTQPDFVDWPSYDAFLHGCLLGRPARAWQTFDGGLEKLNYARWADNAEWYDPRRTSDLAFAARGREAPHSPLREPAVGPGLSAWRDENEATLAARDVLGTEAGLKIPRIGFVLGVVGAYFLALVPINWWIFSRFGKPQWAWGAAPLIALGFSAFVIQSAQLDIGFARSAQELVLVELQPGYQRGHAARWGVVYNSLGADYTFTTTEPTTLVLPMAAGGRPLTVGADSSAALVHEEGPIADAAPRRALAGFVVESNNSALYRSEQMLDCGGTISWEPLGDGRCRVRNGTPWELTDVRISGAFSAIAPSIAAGASVELSTTTVDAVPPPASPKLSPREQFRSAVAGLPGDSLQLSAWISAVPGDLEMEPPLSQFRSSTLVLAHLQYPDAALQRDRNLPVPDARAGAEPK